tara:strand:+ start:564 stop:782 length:219 start_codon:yes stop_codon:yes gene_type:complete
MDTKVPDHWKELRLELKDPVIKKEKYKTYKALLNDHDEYKKKSYTSPKYITPLPCSKRPKPLPKPLPKCSIQ